jgi:hypothetical protein
MSIEEVDLPIRMRSPHQSGKRIDDAAEFVLNTGPFAAVAVTGEFRHSAGERRSYLSVGVLRRSVKAAPQWHPTSRDVGQRSVNGNRNGGFARRAN